jgi:excisionase family DNA binding protein
MSTDEQLLNISQVAFILGISAPSVRRRIATGDLPAVQLGNRKTAIRVRRDDLERYLAGHAVAL